MKTWARQFARRTFDSLFLYNYRLYFYGQATAMTGAWMISVAQGLLVLMLTGSGTDLGIVTALQTLPILVLGAWGGVFVDRYPKRDILLITQSLTGLVSLWLGIMIYTNHITLWMVYLAAVLNGLIKVFDNPTRQTFVREMVGSDHLTNAVSLNSMMINLARVAGPALAGVLVATVGIAMCFIVGGVSYVAVIWTLLRMRIHELKPAAIVKRAKGQMAEGWRYVRSEPVVRNTLLMMTIVGTFTYEFSVVLPLLAEFTFKNGASGYAALTSAMGIGAVVGGLYTAGRRRSTARMLVISSALFGGSVLLVSFAPTFLSALIAMVVVGFFSINFTSLANVTIQLASRQDMQGRVMSFWSIAFLGTTPIGGPIMGAIGEHAGARVALFIGGLAAIAAAGLGLASVNRPTDDGVD